VDRWAVDGRIHKVGDVEEMGEQGKWRKKFPRVAKRARKRAAAASRRASRPRARLLWRVYRICARRGVRGIAKCASAVVSAPSWARLPGPATRDKNPGAAIRVAADL